MKRVLIKKDVRYHLRESGSIKLEYLIDGEITPTFIITKLSKQKDKPQEYELECLIEYDKLSENGLLKSYSCPLCFWVFSLGSLFGDIPLRVRFSICITLVI